jgi:hypothetical protein
MSSPEYYLLWKGRQSGPFSLAIIREQLAAGEINRMYQVGIGGRWIMLGEFLVQQDGGPMEARRRAEAAQRQSVSGQREEQLRREYEAQLVAERAQQSALQERLAEAEKRSPLSHLLPPQPPPEASSRQSPPQASSRQSDPPPTYAPVRPVPAPPVFDPPSPDFPPPGYTDPFGESDPPSEPTRTNPLAIATLVLSIGNIIPYVNFVTWLPAIIVGHIALSQIKRDPKLGGRGLVLAGLVATYSLLGLGLIAGLVYRLTTGHAPHL